MFAKLSNRLQQSFLDYIETRPALILLTIACIATLVIGFVFYYGLWLSITIYNAIF